MFRARLTRTPRLLGLAALLTAAAIAPVAGQRPARPSIPNIAGTVLTVNGPVDPSVLGETLMHEHIFIEFQRPVPQPPTQATALHRWTQQVTLEHLSAIRMGNSVRENGFLGDFEESLAEILEFKRVGGGTIVDVSNFGLGRDARALQRVSHASGLHVVMGAGWYQKAYHPLDMDKRTVEEMTDIIVRDVAAGVDGTAIRSGVIGEVGINGNPLTPNELKSTRASARASRLTGAPISFHVGGVGEEKFTILDLVQSEGVDMSHVVMGHSNALALDIPFAKRVFARGVYVEFDYLGAMGGPGGWLSGQDDLKVAQGIAALVKEGYADKIVLAHDVCTKIQLKKYGGQGYDYITNHFLPVLRQLGVSEQDIRKIMVDNPRKALTFTAPQQLVQQTSTNTAAR